MGPTRTTPPGEQLPAAELRGRPAQLAAPAVRREAAQTRWSQALAGRYRLRSPGVALAGERGGAFLPACKALPGAPRRMLLLPWPAVTRGVHSWRTGRRRRLPQRPLPAWLFFFFFLGWWRGTVSFCARAAGWHRPLLCPLGPGQEAHLLWDHLLAHPPSHFRQSPQRNAILQDVSSGEPPFVLPARSLST